MNFYKFTLLNLIALVLVSQTWAVYTELLWDLGCGAKFIELYENDIQPMVGSKNQSIIDVLVNSLFVIVISFGK